MCGIVGLFIKNPELEKNLGALLSPMLIEMTERGPDSTGIAVYGETAADNMVKLTVLSSDPDYDWEILNQQLVGKFGQTAYLETRSNHAVLFAQTDADSLNTWVKNHYPELSKASSGTVIEIFKEKGLAVDMIEKFSIESMQGSHALGHTRMATESAVTTEHSHPFSTGEDLCLVHNGSLSNHNRLRQELQAKGIEFQTDNDSEVAAGYLSLKLREGASLDEALEMAIKDLDGFYTFAVGSKDGFAVLRDPIGCKPAILAETDDWVAMASEFRSIAGLPGVENAKIWEPEPARIYSWKKN